MSDSSQIQVRSLDAISEDDICAAFLDAFQDYAVSFTPQSLRSMWKRRGFVPSLSFGAFDGDRLVSFTLNGVGTFDGCQAAYDTGTGTIKEYQGRGLAKRVFEESLPTLRAAGISLYVLEVLQSNDKAFSVYSKVGFEVSRELNFFLSEKAEVNPKAVNLPEELRIDRLVLDDLHERLESFWDFVPSWQNSFESVGRAASSLASLGAWEGDTLVGYCIFDPVSGDITQIAVATSHRRRGIASSLLRRAAALCDGPRLKLINTDAGCSSITAFAQSCGLKHEGRQYEMKKRI